MANKSRAPRKTPRAAKPKGVQSDTVNGIESLQPFLAAQLLDAATPSGAARKAAMSPEEVSARVREFNLKPTVQHGKVVEGPFDTNAAAWKALDLGRRRLQPAA